MPDEPGKPTAPARRRDDAERRLMARYDALPPGVLPFAVSRETSAALVGISPSKFEELVNDGRMPQPRALDGRVLWDVEELRAAWRALPRRGEAAQNALSAWDKALAR